MLWSRRAAAGQSVEVVYQVATIRYDVNELGLIVAEGDSETDAEPCANCSHQLVKHTGVPGVLNEFAPFNDCDEDGCRCPSFEHTRTLYDLKSEAMINAVRSSTPRFFHVTHTCGHQAWWSDANLADRVSNAKCPWCGAENGILAPLGPVRGQNDVFILPSLDPLPRELYERAQGNVLTVHRADDACCPGSVVTASR